MSKIYLPQFAGESNPYDVLWYLAIEIGRVEMLKIQSIGSELTYNIRSESEKALRKKYEEVAAKVAALTDEEREFLKKDSRTCNGITINRVNNSLMELSAESMSDMSLMHSLDSEDYLCATLGEEEGKKECERRISLIKKFKGIELTKEVIEEHEISERDVDYIETVRKCGMESILAKY